MDFEDWQPFYRQIIEDFGFSIEGDESVAEELDRLLDGRRIGKAELRSRIRGQTVTIAGNAPSLASELDKTDGILITADEATSVALAKGLSPTILVTDLDGEVKDQLRANDDGTIAVVHGHGDNGPAVREWAPRFRGPTLATTQSRPAGRLENFGGFTDGDRAVYLADHFGARTIRLVGFDFERPNPKDSDLRTKQRKLDWAYILLQNLDREELDL
jgi:2-amino-4-hydroxy-6-hydroxymethyldihydropteridine diphosphokinase